MFSSIQLLIPSTKIYYIRHINFYSIKLYKKTTNSFFQEKLIPRIVLPVFLNISYNNSTTNFLQQNSKNSTTCFPQGTIPPVFPKTNCIEKVTKIIMSATWDIIKSKSIYVWDNVDNIIQINESQVYFNFHTTDLYD